MADLMKRLEALVEDLGEGRACCGVDYIDAAVDAAAHIEALEAQLAKADALAEAVEVLASSLPPRARETLHAIIAACLAAQVEKRK